MVNVGLDFFQQVYRQQFQIKTEGPVNETRMYSFEKVCELLEQDVDLYTSKDT